MQPSLHSQAIIDTRSAELDRAAAAARRRQTEMAEPRWSVSLRLWVEAFLPSSPSPRPVVASKAREGRA
jgi:hypothetical protein